VANETEHATQKTLVGFATREVNYTGNATHGLICTAERMAQSAWRI